MHTDGYEATSRALLAKAREELSQGDLLQASEKLWGAAAHAVKAVAARRQWPHESHRALFEIVNRLATETGDRNLRPSFDVAAALHVNFYELTRPSEFIEDDAQVIEEFVAKLEGIP